MTAAKKRDLFEEIREGLEAYRHRRDALSRRKLSPLEAKAIREQFGMSQSDIVKSLNVSK